MKTLLRGWHAIRRQSWHRIRPGTLRGRLALLALFTTAVWVVLLTVVFNVALAGRLHAEADDLLRTRATAVAATVQVRPDRALTIREPADDRALDTGIWIYQGRHALERPTAPGPAQHLADRLAGRAEVFDETGGNAATRLYALPIRHGGRQVGTVVTAVALDPYRRTAESALTGSVGLALLLLGGVYLVARTVIGRALRPVTAMSRQAARWSGHDIGRRFGTAQRPAELEGLAANLDELLDRLAAVLRHEQQLSAELSHELRTPLARIIAELDWALARPRGPEERTAALEAIAQGADRMWTICETLLTEARARGSEAPGRCALGALVRDVATRSAHDHPAAPPIDVRLDDEESALVAGVSPAVAERILAPLLDNARRYAVDAITLECAARPEGVRVVVADDGPGVPDRDRDAIFDPGHRAHPTDGHHGAGLGLPLARRLARTSGGDLTLGPTTSGARFVVSLPAG
ncbi:HAMP domain-containing sensor histidine kinase [Streptomyces sp. NPDC005962]|uniref:sensor histidine kinase n=1 Tax=Streptomyces sp. NPDC005962 TaxID=3154466 RepID=UPI0033F9DD21